MRVAIVTETFLPYINGVTNSVMRVAEHLRDNGHDAIIVGPSNAGAPDSYAGFPFITIPAVSFPLLQDLKLGFPPSFVLDRILGDFAPDVVHAASPFLMASTALVAAAHFLIPSVAIYQTDIPGFARPYGIGFLETAAWARVRDIHELATLTLAPSSMARDSLIEHGIPRVKLWGRGVDTERFSPERRDQALHDTWAPHGEIVIGYMGRLAHEKQVSDLTVLTDLPNTKLVIVGGGPTAKALQTQMPKAIFTGELGGTELARITASLDVFVHPGELETFGQAIQEALASGVPVVATAKGGPVDLIDSGQRGFLYTPGDLDQMRSQVEQLVNDPDLRHRFGVAAREYALTRTWPVICAQLVDYYREVIAMTAGAVPDLR